MTSAIDASTVEFSLLDAANRSAQSWRRAFWFALLLAVAAFGLALVLATKSHTEGVIYKEDAAGDIALIGLSATNGRASDLTLKKEFASWLTYVRTISNDQDLADFDADRALAMTAPDSQANTDLHTFYRTQNPKHLARTGFTRTVTDVEVSFLTASTIHLAWKETLRNNDGSPRYNTYSGTVYLAQAPHVPDNPQLGKKNPAGIFIAKYDLPWGTLQE